MAESSSSSSHLEKYLTDLQHTMNTVPQLPFRDLMTETTSSSSNSSPEKGKGRKIISPEEYDFSFTIVPGSMLKHSIASLTERDLNSTGMARIDVSEDGFEVTVRDYTRKAEELIEVTGFLSLKAAGVLGFKCNKPLSKMIKLDDIARFMETADDRGIVRVFSVDGTMLSVESFKKSDTGVSKLHSMETTFSRARRLKRFPTVHCAFEQAIPSDKMGPLLNSILADIPNDERPKFGEARVEQTVRIKAGPSEVTVEDEKIMWFLMSNWLALKKASRLSDTCFLYMVMVPEEHILLRFPLKEVGDLFILKTTQACIAESQPKSMFTFRSRTIGPFHPHYNTAVHSSPSPPSSSSPFAL